MPLTAVYLEHSLFNSFIVFLTIPSFCLLIIIEIYAIINAIYSKLYFIVRFPSKYAHFC